MKVPTGSENNEAFEQLCLRLFVSGASPRSLRAVASVRKLCEAALPRRYTLEVVDIYRDPTSARDNQIVAVPTLLKTSPTPRRLFIGDMSDTAALAAGLGLFPSSPCDAEGPSR